MTQFSNKFHFGFVVIDYHRKTIWNHFPLASYWKSFNIRTKIRTAQSMISHSIGCSIDHSWKQHRMIFRTILPEFHTPFVLLFSACCLTNLKRQNVHMSIIQKQAEYISSQLHSENHSVLVWLFISLLAQQFKTEKQTWRLKWWRKILQVVGKKVMPLQFNTT